MQEGKKKRVVVYVVVAALLSHATPRRTFFKTARKVGQRAHFLARKRDHHKAFVVRSEEKSVGRFTTAPD